MMGINKWGVACDYYPLYTPKNLPKRCSSILYLVSIYVTFVFREIVKIDYNLKLKQGKSG